VLARHVYRRPVIDVDRDGIAGEEVRRAARPGKLGAVPVTELDPVAEIDQSEFDVLEPMCKEPGVAGDVLVGEKRIDRELNPSYSRGQWI
jgi:hypothetical protein